MYILHRQKCTLFTVRITLFSVNINKRFNESNSSFDVTLFLFEED